VDTPEAIKWTPHPIRLLLFCWCEIRKRERLNPGLEVQKVVGLGEWRRSGGRSCRNEGGPGEAV